MTTAVPKHVLNFETQWLRTFASTYHIDESGFEFPDHILGKRQSNLVEIRNALRRCNVIHSEKLDGVGAIWIAEGPDDEQEQLRISLYVASQEMYVRLVDVERLGFESEVKRGRTI